MTALSLNKLENRNEPVPSLARQGASCPADEGTLLLLENKKRREKQLLSAFFI